MGIVDFSLYNNFSCAVLILGCDKKIAFRNIAFLNNFGNVKNLEKFSNYFSFDICVLDSDNILNSNPVNYAIESKENFSANATYQKTDRILYYRINSFFNNEYKILMFNNITPEILYEETEKKYNFIRQQYLTLAEENKQFASLQTQAQAQTVKLGLLNRISNVVRESIDLNKIINSALRELFNLFGAIKVYYAPYEDGNFYIEQVYPSKYKNFIGQRAEFSADTKRCISLKKIKVNSCIKDFLNSETAYPAQVNRIIIPVTKMHDILGILLIYTNQKSFDDSQNDVLQSIAAQLASAITQASLFLQIKQKNEELENTLKELKETQLQLINSEKMASLGQLVAGVAHEINTPLASINSNNDILKKLIEKLPQEPSEKDCKMFFENIKNINQIDKEAIKRISNIVMSLKKFVRLDEAEQQEADINNELDLTLQLIKHETKNKIKVTKNYSKLPLVKCYPNMLNQVFMNILVNACQSMPDGGELVVTTLEEDNNLIVKIKDTGTGIDESIKDKLFTAGATTKQIGIGTGLGLAISKKIIEKHDGRISFTSEKNKGTEFVISIPLNRNNK